VAELLRDKFDKLSSGAGQAINFSREDVLRQIFIIMLFSVSFVFGQTKIASLETGLEKSRGQEKIDILNDLSFEYRNEDNDKGLELADKALELSRKVGYEKGIATALQNKGINLEYLARNDEALKLQKKSLEMFQKMNDHEGVGESLINIGNIYLNKNNNKKGLELYFKALQIAEENDDKVRIVKLYNNIGDIYSNIGNLTKAEKYVLKAIEIQYSLNDRGGLTYPFTNLGRIYWQKGKLDSALIYMNKANVIDLEFKNKRGIAFNATNIGTIKLELHEYDEAKRLLGKAFLMCSELKDTASLAYIGQNLGLVAYHEENYSLAQSWFEQGLVFAEATGNSHDLYYAYTNLYYVHYSQGNTEKAMEYRHKYAMLEDSLVNQEANKEIAELETRFETRKKEKEIVNLKSEKKIQKLLLVKQNQIKNVLLVASLIILVIGMIIFFMYRLKNKANIKLIEANRIIQKHRMALEEVNTEQKKLLQELHDLNATKDKFFSIIAHDLKGPLQVLLSGSRLLTNRINDMDKLQISDIATEMQANTKKLFELLENLLQWARIQMGKVEIIPQSMNLNLLVRKWVELLNEQAGQKEIEISNKIAADLQIMADRNMTESVIHNIIANAIKFTNTGGQIEVLAWPQNGNIEIVVKDNGIGISEKTLKKLFGLEENISTAGTKGEKGTGLGLILCKEFVEKNQGSIWIDSKLGQGTEVHVTLPAVMNN